MHAGSTAVPDGASPIDAVRLFVNSRLGGRVQDLRLEMPTDRCLILQGRTNTYYAKQLAQQIALEAMGDGVELLNEIIVC